ncbi:MAG: hypothetical protein GPOALKHO_001609 [Sodalis sp.]|uniref:hypothetical protein n=1 Tax=Sodalis sp. (in: enterobacteria) TaxID=1898979 RepID=UPI00387356A3|nr:MAG: hypothetical protein GPOALKHO_001609 [Sodalis sp.]
MKSSRSWVYRAYRKTLRRINCGHDFPVSAHRCLGTRVGTDVHSHRYWFSQRERDSVPRHPQQSRS